MGLLWRLEKAQDGSEKSGSVAVAHPPGAEGQPPAQAAQPVHAPSPLRGGNRENFLADLALQVLDEVMPNSGSLVGSNSAEIHKTIESIIDRIIAVKSIALSHDERQHLLLEAVAEVQGFGPIESLLQDDTITEVMVNGPNQVYIERKGKLILTNVRFRSDEHVRHIIDRIIAPLGRRIDESSPRVDARLPDGSRVNAIIAPLSLIGPVITIRKFSKRPYTVQDLVGFGTATAEMFDFLKACVEAKINVFVSGGTGSGKTTFLNVISSFIPEDERIVTIEDAAELQLHQEHVVTLEARPANIEGHGEITIRELLRNALHMRPDRIIVGECRGGEALDMIQAMTVGHAGSLSTGHANSPPDMLRRLETMILMAGCELPLRAIREQVSSGVDLIVHTARLRDGSRKVINITEVYGIEDDVVLTQDIFVFEQTDFVDGKIVGHLKPTGLRPTFMPKFKEFGVPLPPGEYGIPPEDPAHPDVSRRKKGTSGEAQPIDPAIGLGRAVKAAGLVFVSSVGPVDPQTQKVVTGGVKEQTARCIQNLKDKLEAEGSSLDNVVWANWSLRDGGDFDDFNKEWVSWFPAGTPVGQGTLMPILQRRVGFRVSIGAIAADDLGLSAAELSNISGALSLSGGSGKSGTNGRHGALGKGQAEVRLLEAGPEATADPGAQTQDA
jgi:pilus assembly protein CpaF